MTHLEKALNLRAKCKRFETVFVNVGVPAADALETPIPQRFDGEGNPLLDIMPKKSAGKVKKYGWQPFDFSGADKKAAPETVKATKPTTRTRAKK